MTKKNIFPSFVFLTVFMILLFVQFSFGQNNKLTKITKTNKQNEKLIVNKLNILADKIDIQDTILNVVPENDSIKIIGNNKYVLNQKNAHASYYAAKFTGRRTASGKIFNNNAYTCAHRKLPFGTKLRVTANSTGKSVYVIVTDRGPFVRGRHIDLSKRSFFDIAPKSYGGSIAVTIEIVK